jgi:hypothetical protein
MTNIYYVYQYVRKDQTPYYIGKGKGNRAWSSIRTHKPPNDKNRIIIIAENLTEDQAFILERELIAKYGRKDNGTGILRNKTDGGEGPSGVIVSNETRRKMSKNNSMNDIKNRIKISKKLKGVKKTEAHKKNMFQPNNFPEIIAKRKGENHYKYDPRIFAFYNVRTNILEVCTQRTLINKYNLNKGNITMLVNHPNKVKSVLGWTIKKPSTELG